MARPLCKVNSYSRYKESGTFQGGSVQRCSGMCFSLMTRGANCKEAERKQKHKHWIWLFIQHMDHNHLKCVVSWVLNILTHTGKPALVLLKFQAKPPFLHGSPSCKTSAFHPNGRRCRPPPPCEIGDSERIMTIPFFFCLMGKPVDPPKKQNNFLVVWSTRTSANLPYPELHPTYSKWMMSTSQKWDMDMSG